MDEIKKLEFFKFRNATLRMQRIVLNSTFFMTSILGAIRWYRDIAWNSLSIEMLFVLLIAFPGFIFLPRISYLLSRYVVGSWYKKEFGINYAEYCRNEKLAQASELLENEALNN